MLFNSYSFIFIFLPITFLGMLLLGSRSPSGAVLWLGIASLVFYAFWNPIFVTLLLGSIIFNYVVARWIQKRRNIQLQNKLNYILILAITLNIVLLGYFKYTNFFLSTIIEGAGGTFQPLDIIIPLGISFFTFTQIAFLIDVSRGFTSEHNFSRYLLFVTFFPYLIAGPVLHHKQMIPQFSDAKNFRFNQENVCAGISIFIIGLAKKIFLADNLGEIANPFFDTQHTDHPIQLVEAWVGAISYTLQLYFDFSAYSDMAVGLSLIFNLRLPLNFNSPFKASSVIEFWQRWHMSLTKYIGEYLYTPISLKLMRQGLGRAYILEVLYTLILPTLITFFIIGLWHGANWTYVMFGVVHGIFLVINHLYRAFKKKVGWRKKPNKFNIFCSTVLTYIVVVIAFVFFRADSLSSAYEICLAMFGFHGISLPATVAHFFSAIPHQVGFFILSFDGVLPSKLFTSPNWYVFGLLLVGQCIVWFLPNVHQIMLTQKIVCEDLGDRPAIKRPTSLGKLNWLIWKPNLQWGIVLGTVFFVIVLVLASNKPSTFLYYQF